MRYRVRTQDGELGFANIAELSKAWQLGLIEPDDEVLEEGHQLWRKAGTLPFLVQYAKQQPPLLDPKLRFLLVATVSCGLVALYWLVKGRVVAGGVLGVGVALLSMVLVRAAYSKRR